MDCDERLAWVIERTRSPSPGILTTLRAFAANMHCLASTASFAPSTRAVASRTARRARLSRAVASVSSGPSVITRAETTLSATRRASLGVASVPRRDVRARAENDGRGPNPNEVEGVSFGGEMVGVGIFLLVAVQFFVLAFVDFPFQR